MRARVTDVRQIPHPVAMASTTMHTGTARLDPRILAEGAMAMLVGVRELAERWELRRDWVSQLTRRPGFPSPVGTIDGRPAWILSEAEVWRVRAMGKGGPLEPLPWPLALPPEALAA